MPMSPHYDAKLAAITKNDQGVRVDNGKYEFRKVGLVIEVFRGGKPWLTLHDGFNALMGMMCELDAARVVLDAARLLGDDAPREIKKALERHRGLVDDRELPSAWAAPW
jgi:hypothetical protein